jgi:hypothetical protein
MDRQNTFDSQTGVAWQTDKTDLEFVKKQTQGKIIPDGMYKGRDMWDVLSAGGKVGPGVMGPQRYDMGRLLVGGRGYWPAERKIVNRPPDDPTTVAWTGDVGAKGLPVDWTKVTPGGNTRAYSSGRRSYSRGGGGGGGSYAPKIYSHPAYSLNADKPAGLYSKTPSYTRFDYLRPKVLTKGSREAYRREDF